MFYPIKRGIALKNVAFSIVNTALYYITIILYVVLTIYCVALMGSIKQAVVPIILLITMVMLLHCVRRKSEKELRA